MPLTLAYLFGLAEFSHDTIAVSKAPSLRNKAWEGTGQVLGSSFGTGAAGGYPLGADPEKGTKRGKRKRGASPNLSKPGAEDEAKLGSRALYAAQRAQQVGRAHGGKKEVGAQGREPRGVRARESEDERKTATSGAVIDLTEDE